MNKIKLMRLLATMLIIISCSCTIFSANALESETIKTPAPESFGNLLKMSENNKLALYAMDSTGDIMVLDKRTDEKWYSTPTEAQDNPEYNDSIKSRLKSNFFYTTMTNSIDATASGLTSATVMSVPNGVFIKLTLSYKNTSMSIGYNVLLNDDYIEVSIDGGDVLVGSNSFVSTLTLYPYFGAANQKAKGFYLLPDGCGSIMNFQNSGINYMRNTIPLYGTDQTYGEDIYNIRQLPAFLPLYGICRENSAVLVVIDKGAAHASLNVIPAGVDSPYNSVYTSYKVKNIVQGKSVMSDLTSDTLITSKDAPSGISIRYYFLPKEQANLNGLATAAKAYFSNLYDLKKLDSLDKAITIQIPGAFEKQKSFLGFPYKAVETLTTYSEAKYIIEELQKAGVERLNVKYYGAQKGGMDTFVYDKVSAEWALGFSWGLKDLFKYDRENDKINIFFDTPVQSFSRDNSAAKKVADAVKGLMNEYSVIYRENIDGTYKREGNFWFLTHPKSIDRIIKSFSKSFVEYGGSSISLGGLGNNLYSTFNKGNSLTRDITTTLIRNNLKSVKDAGIQNIMLDGGNSYIFGSVNYLTNTPTNSTRMQYADLEVPFYQMITRGTVNMSSEPLNLSDDFVGSKLKCAAYGIMPTFTLMYEKSDILADTDYKYLYSCNYNDYLNDVAEVYNWILPIMEKTGTSSIVNFEWLETYVSKTTYENGAQVIVNYNEWPVIINEKIIETKNYLILN